MNDEFLLFAGETYYPRGGWNDFVGAYATIEEAQAVINDQHGHVLGPLAGYSKPQWWHTGRYDWALIVHGQKVVARFRASPAPSDDEWSSTP